MTKLVLCLFLGAAVFAAESIPAGAKETAPGVYHYTDAQGKKWIYRRTPFGISKGEDRSVDTEKVQAAEDADYKLITVTDLGDKIHFERQTPFSTTKWTKAKSELTEYEKKVVASKQSAAPPPASSAPAAKPDTTAAGH